MLVLEPHSQVMKKVHKLDDEEADDTLSFSDLPLYSDRSIEEYWDEDEEEEDLSAESQGSSSISSSDHDYFEFSSQELISPFAATFPPENIIFCGKLIPYNKQSNTSQKDPSRTLVDNKKKQTSIKKTRGWGVFKPADKQVESKSRVVKHEYEKRYDFPVRKMSILTSSSSGKATRWYLFLFGISRFSSEVELSDIKTRQRSRRRHCSAPPPPQSPALRFRNHHDEVNRGSGLWGLIKVLSCGGNHHPNAMVVSSIDRQGRSWGQAKEAMA